VAHVELVRRGPLASAHTMGGTRHCATLHTSHAVAFAVGSYAVCTATSLSRAALHVSHRTPQVWASWILAIAYPLVTVAITIQGAGVEFWPEFCVATVLLCAVVAMLEFRRRLSRDRRLRSQLAKKLSETDPSAPEFAATFQQAFEAHDLYDQRTKAACQGERITRPLSDR
jgi:hypothetical protein